MQRSENIRCYSERADRPTYAVAISADVSGAAIGTTVVSKKKKHSQ